VHPDHPLVVVPEPVSSVGFVVVTGSVVTAVSLVGGSAADVVCAGVVGFGVVAIVGLGVGSGVVGGGVDELGHEHHE